MKGIMCTQRDDFCFGRDSEFHEDIINKFKENLKVGCEESNQFKYIRIRVKQRVIDIFLDKAHYVKQIDCPENDRSAEDRELEDDKLTEY